MRLCLTVDTETQKYFTPAPHFKAKDKAVWELNKVRRYRYAKGLDGFWNLKTALKLHNVPATFFMVEPLKHLVKDYGSDPLFDIGSHSYSHRALTLMNKVELSYEISKCMGISFAAPFNMLEDTRHPARVINQLARRGFKIARWSGIENGLKQKRMPGISKPFVRHGMLMVRTTSYFEGTSSDEHISKMLDYLYNHKHLDDEYIFCLCTHDFTHKTREKVEYLVDLLKRDFEFVNMRQIWEEHR